VFSASCSSVVCINNRELVCKDLLSMSELLLAIRFSILGNVCTECSASLSGDAVVL
jgi:hypothetical protein